MDERVFTASEVLQILADARACGERRATLGVLRAEEAPGWSLAVKNIAERFGLSETYVEGTLLDVREGL
jgi:hypothetical protein